MHVDSVFVKEFLKTSRVFKITLIRINYTRKESRRLLINEHFMLLKYSVLLSLIASNDRMLPFT